jgi:putative addiction module antidote
MVELKLIPIGDDTGFVLPQELLAGLGVQAGDALCAVMTSDGLHITAGDAVFQRQMDVARRVMRDKRGILRRLAEN